MGARILRAVLNKSLERRVTKKRLYDHLPLILHAGHCFKSKGKLMSDVLE